MFPKVFTVKHCCEAKGGNKCEVIQVSEWCKIFTEMMTLVLPTMLIRRHIETNVRSSALDSSDLIDIMSTLEASLFSFPLPEEFYPS